MKGRKTYILQYEMSLLDKITFKENDNKDFLVIGAGRFGLSIAQELHSKGQQVMLVDIDEEKLDEVKDTVTFSAILDTTEEKALKSIEANKFDVAIVAIGGNTNASILTTLALKEAGTPYVICKAVTCAQGKILSKIGADRIIFPERDMGIRVAQNLMHANILDSIELGPVYSVIEIVTPRKWEGKSIKELDLRNKLELNILAIKRSDSVNVTPLPEEILEKDDVVVILGSKDNLSKISN